MLESESVHEEIPEGVDLCRICGDAKATVEMEGAGHDVACPRCGRYSITGLAENDIDTMEEEERARLRLVAPPVLCAWSATLRKLTIDRAVLSSLLRRGRRSAFIAPASP